MKSDIASSMHTFKLLFGTLLLSVFLLVPCILIFIFFPVKDTVSVSKVNENQFFVDVASFESTPDEEKEAQIPSTSLNVKALDFNKKVDAGLSLYRQPFSRAAVEWFYIHITEDRDVALAILEEADKNDIPFSLAFALAHTESNYKVRAVNKNKNSSIDRGLFQLNNKSFPKLEEEDFFNPYVSAKYGMSHLRFCLDTAGNEIAALAMYNAGTNKVRNNNTPQITLNYVSKIVSYKDNLDVLFAKEVLAFYDNSTETFIAQK